VFSVYGLILRFRDLPDTQDPPRASGSPGRTCASRKTCKAEFMRFSVNSYDDNVLKLLHEILPRPFGRKPLSRMKPSLQSNAAVPTIESFCLWYFISGLGFGVSGSLSRERGLTRSTERLPPDATPSPWLIRGDLPKTALQCPPLEAIPRCLTWLTAPLGQTPPCCMTTHSGPRQFPVPIDRRKTLRRTFLRCWRSP